MITMCGGLLNSTFNTPFTPGDISVIILFVCLEKEKSENDFSVRKIQKKVTTPKHLEKFQRELYVIVFQRK